MLPARIDEIDVARRFGEQLRRELACARQMDELGPRPRRYDCDRLVPEPADEVRIPARDDRDLRDDDDAPGRVRDHAFGPAETTDASTVSVNPAKLSRNMRARSAALRP